MWLSALMSDEACALQCNFDERDHQNPQKGGICFFAAGNRLAFMEPHYRLPLLSVLRGVSQTLCEAVLSSRRILRKAPDLLGLKRLVSRFQVVDYTAKVIRSPVTYHAEEVCRPGSMRQRIAIAVSIVAHWALPTYLYHSSKRLKDCGRWLRFLAVLAV